MLRAPLPEEIRLDEEVRVCVDADLRPDGTLGREWLAITPSKLLVISKDGEHARVRHELPLSEVSDPKTTTLVGGGAFEVMHDGNRCELIRFTTARAADFAAAAQLLEKWLKGEEALVPEAEILACPRCGLPLEAGTKVCPACLPRSRTLRRLIAYLRPC